MPEQARIVIIGDKSLKEVLGIDVMRQLQATVEGIGISGKKDGGRV